MQKIQIDDFGCLPLAILLLMFSLSLALNGVADALDNVANAVAAQHK